MSPMHSQISALFLKPKTEMKGYKQEKKKQTVLHLQDPNIPQEKSHS